MIKKRKVIIVALIFTCLCFSCLFAFSFSSASVNDYELRLSTEIKQEYYLEDEFNVPTGKFMGTKDVDASAVVVYPSGNREAIDKVIFSVTGQYSVEYSAMTETGMIKETVSFNVYDKKYSVDYSSASAVYESAHTFNTVGQAEAATTIDIAGLNVVLTEGSTFTYNKVFDLTDKTKDDLIFSANIIPSVRNEADFWQITVRFTDIYDTTNYVDVVLCHSGSTDKTKDVQNDGTNYLRAGASIQPLVGCVYGDYTRKDSNFGSWTTISFMDRDGSEGVAAVKDSANETFDIYFDYAERKIYGPNRGIGSGRNLITDLDEPSLYSSLWQGFTTGECVVSVFAENFRKSSGTVFIQRIFEDSGEDFAGEKLIDQKLPEISVDLSGYSESNLPFAIVGIEYPLFTASSFDYKGGIKDFYTQVYYNYNSDSRVRISIKDGCFLPEYEGIYTVKYIAVDYFGNVAEKTLNLECKSNANKLSLDVKSEVREYYTGERIDLPKFELSNNSGNVTVKITAENGKNNYEIDADELSFKPMSAGVYLVVYSVTDYLLQTQSKTIKITVLDKTEPVFANDPVFAKYLVQGYEQIIPEVSAYDFKSNGELIKADVYIKEDDGEEFKLDGSYVPSMKGYNYPVKITYKAVGKDGTAEVSYDLTAISITKDASLNTVKRNIDKKKLFVVDKDVSSGYAAISLTDETQFVTYATDCNNAGITYVNKLPAVGFSLDFNVFSNYNSFGSLNVILTDSENSNISVKTTISKGSSDSVYVSINDGYLFPVTGISFENQSKEIDFGYSNTNKNVTLNYSASSFSVEKDLSGNVFNGFPSNYVYLRIEFADVTGVSKIAVQKIFNQRLMNTSVDNADPVFSICGEYEGFYSQDTVLDLFAAVCADMIAPETTTSVTVYSPSGDIVVAEDGTVLENLNIGGSYKIKLKEIGKYKIVYAIEGMKSMQTNINVIDDVMPEIVIETEFNQTYKVGETIKLKAYATDNYSENLSVFINVVDSIGNSTSVTDAYKFTRSGWHSVSFYTFDERDNYAVKVVKIYVEEK